MKPNPSLGALVILITLGAGCGGPSLGDLEGSYDLTALADDIGSGELVDCNLAVERGGGSARCERSSTTSSVHHETLAVDFVVGDDTVDAEIVYVAELDGSHGYYGDCGARVCTTTITGEAIRNQSNDAKRRDMFKAAAGEWSGHVVIEKECVPAPDVDASERCHGDEEALALDTYVFEASVFGNFAEVTWIGDDQSGGFEVIGTGEALQIDGTLVPKR